jgi:hypothetical protein
MQKLELLYVDGFHDAISLAPEDRHAVYLVLVSPL